MKRKHLTFLCLILSILGTATITQDSSFAASLWKFGFSINPESQNSIAMSENNQPIDSNKFPAATNQAVSPAAAPLPDYAAAEMVLSLLPTFENVAAKMQAQGKDGRIWSNYLQRHLGFTQQQVAAMRQISTDFKTAVLPIQNRAKQIITQRRAARASGQPTTPPPTELISLQQQRQTLALQYSNRLRTSLGAAPFQQLQQLLQRNDSELQTLTPAVRQEVRQQRGNLPANSN